MDESDDSDLERNWTRRCEAIHRIKLSLLYHLKHERFLEGVDRFVNAFTAVTATSAAATLYKATGTAVSGTPGTLEVSLTTIAAVLSIFGIVYGPGGKARAHGLIASNMRRLWRECVAAGEGWTAATCDEFESKVLMAEEGEPAQLGALVVQCENEIAVSLDNLEGVRVLPWCMSVSKHVWNWDTTSLRGLSSEEIEERRARASRRTSS